MTNEQEKLLQEIRERHRLRPKHGTEIYVDAVTDVTLLLSLVDSQVAALAEANKRLDDALVRAAEDQDYDSEQRTKIESKVRSACIEKVKDLARERVKQSKPDAEDHVYDQAVAYVLLQTAEALESVTIQEQKS